MTEPPIQTGVDDVHPHPRHTGARWVDLTLALSAIFISAVSLAVAIDHGRTERQLVAANSWPFLREILSHDHKGGAAQIEFGAYNAGVGPAKIHWVEVYYQGAPLSSPKDLLRKCCGLGPTESDYDRQLPDHYRYSIVDQMVMRPGEGSGVMSVTADSTNPVVARLYEVLPTLKFRACYCSVFDECWISNLAGVNAQPVKACGAPPHRFDPEP